MKKVFCFAGAGFAIVTVAVIVMNTLRTREKNGVKLDSECDVSGEGDSSVQEIALTEEKVVQDTTSYEDEKNYAAGSIHSRHQDTAAIMKDSLNAIHENVKAVEETNNKIDDVSDELERLLNEN